MIYKSILKLFIIVISLAAFLQSCSQTPKKTKLNLQPKIYQIQDLGLHELKQGLNFNKIKSDTQIYPGEWLAVSGQGFDNATISIDGDEITSQRQVSSNQILLRIPTGLSKLTPHKLSIQNNYGSDTIEFRTQHYIIGTDTDYNNHFFMRVGLDENNEVLIEPRAAEIKQDRPLYTMISHDASLLYAIGLKSREDNDESRSFYYEMEIKIISLVANKKPSEIARYYVTLNSTPTDAKLSPSGEIVLLGKKELLRLKVNELTSITEIDRFDLPVADPKTTTYTDMEFLQNGKALVVLNSGENQILTLDFADSGDLKLQHKLDIFPDASRPSISDIFADPTSADKFYILSGRNLRNFARNTVDAITRILRKTKTTINDKDFSQVMSFQLAEDGVHSIDSISLPQNQLPFFGQATDNGKLYVSAVDWELYEFTDENETWYKRIPNLLKGTASLGKIYEIDFASNTVDISSQGLGLYFHFDVCPDLGVVFNLVKLGGKPLPPFYALKWGFALQTTGTYGYRNVSSNALLPPYSVGRIAIQH